MPSFTYLFANVYVLGHNLAKKICVDTNRIYYSYSLSSVSLCEQNEDKGKRVTADGISLLDLVAQEDMLGDYEDRLTKQAQDGLEGLTDEETESEDLDLGSDLVFGDEM